MNKNSKINISIIIQYSTNSITILKQKPSCKASSRIIVAWYVSYSCNVMVGPNEYCISLINLFDSSRGRCSVPIRSAGIAKDPVKYIRVRYQF